MVATKISALGALTGIADADEFPVVDVSDTAQAASGSTKAAVATEVALYVQKNYITVATPATPAAGRLTTFAESVGGRSLLSSVGPSGVDINYQPHLARNRVARWRGTATATISFDGAATLTAVGTATAVNNSTTNLHTWMVGTEFLQGVAGTTVVAGFKTNTAQWCRGAAAKIGGWHYVCRWGPATGVATTTNRGFMGLVGGAATPTDVQPSTIINKVGMGWDAADTNIQMMHMDATTNTKVDLGASFPVPTVDRTKVYELAMFCPPNGSNITWQVTDLATDAVATGTISTTMPVATTLMSAMGWLSVGGTSSVAGIALKSLYIETDY